MITTFRQLQDAALAKKDKDNAFVLISRREEDFILHEIKTYGLYSHKDTLNSMFLFGVCVVVVPNFVKEEIQKTEDRLNAYLKTINDNIESIGISVTNYECRSNT